jgi:hypothetical protein
MSDRPGPGVSLGGLSGIALTVRFLLEIAGVVALAWWGINTGSDDLSRAAYAIGASGGLVIIWALVVAPKARNPIALPTRLLIGSALLLVAARALWVVGPEVLGMVFAVLVVLDTLVLVWLDRPPAATPPD